MFQGSMLDEEGALIEKMIDREAAALMLKYYGIPRCGKLTRDKLLVSNLELFHGPLRGTYSIGAAPEASGTPSPSTNFAPTISNTGTSASREMMWWSVGSCCQSKPSTSILALLVV
jgi:hypothetical protein